MTADHLPSFHAVAADFIDDAGTRWSQAPGDPESVTVSLRHDEIEVLRAHREAKMREALSAGHEDQAAQQAERHDMLLRASIMSRLTQATPDEPSRLPRATVLDEQGLDRQGRRWVLEAPAPGVWLVPMRAAQCLAVWHAYAFEGSRCRAAGDRERAVWCETMAGEFMNMARAIDFSVSMMAENPPGFGQAGWS